MLPGVILNEPLSPRSFNCIKKSVLCCISTSSNYAPLAVGYTAMSSEEMFLSGGRGKAVTIFHVLGDHICSLDTPIPRPLLDRPMSSALLSDSFGDMHLSNIVDEDDQIISSDHASEQGVGEATEARSTDELLIQCFMRGLKTVKDNQLPMPVNVFYAQHVIAQKPPSIELDVKKTTYKKVGVFLRKMEDDGFITLEEAKPGVLFLKSVCRDHPNLCGVEPLEDNSTSLPRRSWPDGYAGPPTLEDVKLIEGPAQVFFAKIGYRSGSCISQPEARKAVDDYVRINKLQCANDPRMVRLDAVLMKICDPKTFKEAPESTLANPIFLLSFQDIFAAALKGLRSVLRISFPGKSSPIIWRKNKPPAISLYTAVANGKHLTRVANVDAFGIDPDLFARRLQSLLACSAGRVDDPRYADTVVIQAQGTHLVAISSMLAESYGIPKRYIQGYTEPKKKKKS
ncbi:unnamed protein product [Calicophoron daubneyi]